MGEKTKPEQPRRKIPFLKHYVPVWALLLMLTMASIATYGVVVLTQQKDIRINEPLLVLPPSAEIALFAGDEVVIEFTVTSAAINPITASVAVSLSPPSNDITLTVQQSWEFVLGTTTVPVTVTASDGAVPGVYTVNISITR